MEYRDALQKQMIEKQQEAIKIQYETFLKEKKILDEIARRMHEEEEK